MLLDQLHSLGEHLEISGALVHGPGAAGPDLVRDLGRQHPVKCPATGGGGGTEGEFGDLGRMDQSLVIGNMAVKNLVGDILEHQVVFVGIGEARRAKFIVHVVHRHRHHVDAPVPSPLHGAIALVGEHHIAFLHRVEGSRLVPVVVAKNPGIAPSGGLLLCPRHVAVVHGGPHRSSRLDHTGRP